MGGRTSHANALAEWLCYLAMTFMMPVLVGSGMSRYSAQARQTSALDASGRGDLCETAEVAPADRN
jgi:hypothetical protein